MQVAQVYQLLNNVTKEILGETAVVAEDLSNVVDIGTQIFNVTDVDNYVKSLINHIGKVIFVNRAYSGSVPSILMDSWEFGSVLEKVSAKIPDASESETWELTSGTSYDPNIFQAPVVSAKFFNKKVCFEVQMSFTERQVKESFSTPTQLNGFISMIYNAVDKSMTIKIDALTMRTINNAIAETIYDEYPTAAYTASSGVKAVNLLKLYNDKFSASLTAANAITNAEFIRFASFMMGVYSDRLTRISTLFNIDGEERFTPKDLQHVVLLSDFAKAADAYLQSDTYHNEFTKLPNAETVPYWQGSGTAYGFSDVSTVKVKTASGHDVEVSGIIGMIFDRDAMGISNLDKRTTTNWNPKAEFFNNWFKFDAGYFTDLAENIVVFFVA